MSSQAFIASLRARGTKLSSLAAIVAAAENLRARGIDVIDLGAGEPDFPTPENIKAAAKRALDGNFTRYTAVSGTMALKEAICARVASDFGADYTPAQCSVTVGGKQAIFNSVVSLIDPGDEVLMEKPCWVSFPEIVNFAEGKVVRLDTEPTDFHLTADQVREAITPRTKLLIVNSPSNPTGRVIDAAEFRKIIEVAADNGVWVIADECYIKFVYAPHQPHSAAALPPELRERVMIAGSLSKTYAMTGWRLGFALGPEAWVAEVTKITSQSTSNVNSITQFAAIAALNESQESVQTMLDEYQRRRDWLIPALNQIPGVKCGMPEGAFYAFPDVKELISACGFENSKQFADTLLYDYGVVLSNGSAFGAEGYLRLSYANSLAAIQMAVARIERMRKERSKR